MQPVCWSALHILRLLELLPCSQDTSGDYIVTYASSYIMTEVPSRSMKAILISRDGLSEGVLLTN